MKEFIEYLTKQLVDNPAEVHVEEIHKVDMVGISTITPTAPRI